MIYALDASSGAMLWSFNSGGSLPAPPSVANGVVYVGGSLTVYALDASTGAELWHDMVSHSIVSSPAAVNGVVYVPSGGPRILAFGLP